MYAYLSFLAIDKPIVRCDRESSSYIFMVIYVNYSTLLVDSLICGSLVWTTTFVVYCLVYFLIHTYYGGSTLR